MTDEIESVYRRLMNQYMTLDDVLENETKFEILLDLINYCEENPTASLAEYREFKGLVMEHGPFPRPDARCLN